MKLQKKNVKQEKGIVHVAIDKHIIMMCKI